MLEELDLAPNIARNKALRENVFMMVVCIELKIPLFVVGKPGSSKSLAKTVVKDKMQGDESQSELFKSFKKVNVPKGFVPSAHTFVLLNNWQYWDFVMNGKYIHV